MHDGQVEKNACDFFLGALREDGELISCMKENSDAAMGREARSSPFLCVYEPKKTGARSARTRSEAQTHWL